MRAFRCWLQPIGTFAAFFPVFISGPIWGT